MTKRRVFIATLISMLLLVGAITVIAQTNDTEDEANSTEENNSVEESSSESSEDQEQLETNHIAVENITFDEEDFEVVAENDKLILLAEQNLGHFIVKNKENGKMLRSFPNPEDLDDESIADLWKTHLQSPFMFKYVEFNIRKDVVKESNFIGQNGETAFQKLDNGFRMDYVMPNIGFSIPIEVSLGEDFVETKVLADEIIDDMPKEEIENDPQSRLVSLKVFPFLGAETSKNENGFLFIPDGPGALVNFKENRASSNNMYKERIYGEDYAFSSNNTFSGRQSVKMPVFGIKAEDQAFLGIVRDGDVYAAINAAASQTMSPYNWVTAEHLFRYRFFQPTSRRTFAGFHTYSEEMQRETRSIRYYLLEGEDPGYVDMAKRYREYLIEEYNLAQIEERENIALQLTLLGGGTEQGFIRDSYLSMTTTEQATQIVKELHSSGIEKMDITYLGWQRGGYDKTGGHYPIAKKLGGNEGMKDFIDFSQKKGFSVYFDASSYTFNNTNKDGFRSSRDGLRDLSSTVIRGFYPIRDNVFVSPRFMENVIVKDFKHAADLQVDGYLFGDGIGSILSTDYNERYLATREEAKGIQQDIIKQTKEELGNVRVTKANFYSLENINHINAVDSEYSFDLFVDETVPFAQIAVHGLLTYSLDYVNVSDSIENMFLKGIEYGALPSYILTYGESHELVESRSLRRFYSTHYKDWEEEIASYYQHYNEALADVQHQFITDHRKIADGVYETTYESGKRIYVNYNLTPYNHEGLVIEAEGYAVLEGGN